MAATPTRALIEFDGPADSILSLLKDLPAKLKEIIPGDF
jgi:hypothetical protein